jgi:hypothetical protein
MKPYRPSNGTEGMIFEMEFCNKCWKEQICKIPLSAMVYEVEDPLYPKHWVCDNDGENPKCLKFEKYRPTPKPKEDKQQGELL